MILDFSSLNENQRLAVEWNEGPLLVLAGPGSGKTRVLTMRVAKLLLDSPQKKFRVLGLTFTNKAAAEMRTRVEQMVPECRERTLLTTFHSFCADILRQHGNHIGLKPDFVILNQEADREAVVYDAIEKLAGDDFDVDQDDVKLLPSIEALLSNCIPESEVLSLYKDKTFGRKLSRLYVEYQRQLVSNNRLDFPSLLVFAYTLLRDNPAIVKQIRTVYPHVCVDEFQDTNLVQYRILEELIGSDSKNLFVVADDDQIIYQWNGASPERLNALRDDFGMSVIQLPANYRCPRQVIVLANKLIKYNLSRAADKEPLYAIRKNSSVGAVRIQHFNSVDGELKWVAEDIRRKHFNETGECVVLARTKKLIEQMASHIEKKGLKASLTVRKTEFASAPFRWLHAVLRLANGRSDREQLRRICKAFYELEGVDLHVREIIAVGGRYGGDLLRAWFENAISTERVERNTRQFLETAAKRIAEKLDFLGFITVALQWLSEQEKNLAGQQEQGFVDYSEELIAWKELQKQILYKYTSDEISLNVFLQELDLSEKSPPVPPDAVRCLTIHSSKGMEFRHVYLIGLVEDQLPSFQSIKKGDQSREMQEERRNCFVAITRTQETLTITYSDEYFGWQKEASRFLREMELI
jgi:DNA helicase-2/ATP-dependent DNA helicase PcrA